MESESMQDLVIVDFCETVVDFQTFDPFIGYVLSKKNRVKYYFICNSLTKTIFQLLTKYYSKIGITNYLYKKILVRSIKGIQEEELYLRGFEYYKSIICNHFIKETLNLIEEYKAAGSTFMIASGGAKYYICFLAEQYGIKDVITTELEVKSGILTGRIKKDCIGLQKAEMISETNTFKLHKSIGKVVGITDSISDYPMLNLCDKKIIISHENHKKWISEDMEEVIWH